ncbi:hypothetical protein PFICI_12223 [Pestalotiopsis fici W106-1]|uniref:ribonuclease H n=1 Tax=Pestalotiopsis fici (strain W106-1 / CGMCC3.15140) TaxID=1229662 RepID=W3WNC8_PESFW|nr:uncharacterized protein PFICI_12223 [Pestalotiopsis fici W106-1]ETS75279.1 hypothetical protein PFICI_12223 [Pestalotiopsis fici W106-1]
MEDEYIPSDALGPQRCNVCDKMTGLKLCSACKVVSYCGAADQATDRPHHKKACKAIKKAREHLEAEEARLRALPADMFRPADVFNTCVGRFWGILDTRDYMRARYAAADALLKVNTRVAVEKALDHLTDMLRLNRSDNMGLRSIVPALQLRLGREQECYDFLKWWATTGSQGDYDWGDTSLPHLDIRGADVLEGIGMFSRNSEVAHLVALTLLKLRLFLDLSRFEDPDYMDDIDDPDHKFDPYERSPGSLSRDLMRRDNVDLRSMTEKLQKQYHMLLSRVQEENPHFWSLLVDDAIDPVVPPMYSPGTKEEAMLVLYYCKQAWEESEDAILMVDADTAKLTPVYKGPNVAANAGTAQPSVGNLEKRRGTGKVFPSIFTPPSPTSEPEDHFPLSLLPPKHVSRFVHLHDRKKGLVYVDGACSNNGKLSPRAGWAVVYDDRYGLTDLKGRLESRGPFGEEYEATSNRAELRAAIAALRRKDWRDEGFECLVVATDSSYVVNGATAWARSWLRNGWTTSEGHAVKNKDLWELLLGEVERWDEQGLKIELWRIPREANTEADAAAKKAAGEMMEYEFTDGPAVLGSRALRYKVIAVGLDHQGLLEEQYPDLCSVIRNRGSLYQASGETSALQLLGLEVPPTVILITDGAVARLTKVWERIIDLLRGGVTVVLAGFFSSSLNEGQFTRLFAKIGLPWERGSYHRATVKLRHQSVPAHLHNSLPVEDSQKPLFVKNVDKSAIWYAESSNPNEGAVVFASVGNGKLGYVGDCSGSEASTAIIKAMCGLSP